MNFHKYADIFPLMDDRALDELAADIEANGLQEPIYTYEEQILDGRNRYLACKLINVEPDYRTYNGSDPISFIVSLNLIRRHLNTVQKAALGAIIEPMFEEEANQRMLAGIKDPEVNLPQGKRGPQSRDIAGIKVGVSGRLVESAAQLKEDRPDIFEKMQEGKIPSMSFAEELINVAPNAVNGVIGEYEEKIEGEGKRAARQWIHGQTTGEEEPKKDVSASVAIELAYQTIRKHLPQVDNPSLHKKWRKWAEGIVALHKERE